MSEVIEAMKGALDALEYVDTTFPNLIGCGVRAQRMEELRVAIAEVETGAEVTAGAARQGGNTKPESSSASVDSPAFVALLIRYGETANAESGHGEEEWEKARAALIAHINAWSDERCNEAINQLAASGAVVPMHQALIRTATATEGAQWEDVKESDLPNWTGIGVRTRTLYAAPASAAVVPSLTDAQLLDMAARYFDAAGGGDYIFREADLIAYAKRVLTLASPVAQSVLPVTDSERKAIYLAGFNASGEGDNGEYPYGDRNASPEDDIDWCNRRDRYLASLASPVAGWVSVEERLPSTALDEDGRTPTVIAHWKREALADNLAQVGTVSTLFLARNVEKFTHWMPLPPAPVVTPTQQEQPNV